MKQIHTAVLGASLFFAAVSPLALAQNFTAPAGWSQSKSGDFTIWTRGASRFKLSAAQNAGDLNAFLLAQIQKDAPFRGSLLHRGTVSRGRNGVLTTIYTFKNQVVTYGVFNRSDGARFLALSSPTLQTLMNDAPILADIARQLNAQSGASPRSNPTNSTRPTRETTRRPARALPSSGPLKIRLPNSQILGIYLDQNYTFGVGGMMIMEYEPVLLLKNGVAVEDFDVPPQELDLASFRAQNPRDVGRWTRTKTGFSVKMNGAKSASEIEGYNRVFAAKAGQKLNGSFSSLGGGGNTALGGDVMIAVSNSYRFFPNGRFTTDRAASGSTSSMTALSTSKNAGTYTLGGHTLTLKFNDGRTWRRLFYFYPSKGKPSDGVIGIGKSAFVKDK